LFLRDFFSFGVVFVFFMFPQFHMDLLLSSDQKEAFPQALQAHLEEHYGIHDVPHWLEELEKSHRIPTEKELRGLFFIAASCENDVLTSRIPRILYDMQPHTTEDLIRLWHMNLPAFTFPWQTHCTHETMKKIRDDRPWQTLSEVEMDRFRQVYGLTFWPAAHFGLSPDLFVWDARIEPLMKKFRTCRTEANGHYITGSVMADILYHHLHPEAPPWQCGDLDILFEGDSKFLLHLAPPDVDTTRTLTTLPGHGGLPWQFIRHDRPLAGIRNFDLECVQLYLDTDTKAVMLTHGAYFSHLQRACHVTLEHIRADRVAKYQQRGFQIVTPYTTAEPPPAHWRDARYLLILNRTVKTMVYNRRLTSAVLTHPVVFDFQHLPFQWTALWYRRNRHYYLGYQPVYIRLRHGQVLYQHATGCYVSGTDISIRTCPEWMPDFHPMLSTHVHVHGEESSIYGFQVHLPHNHDRMPLYFDEMVVHLRIKCSASLVSVTPVSDTEVCPPGGPFAPLVMKFWKEE
jgi:hypothetical protein